MDIILKNDSEAGSGKSTPQRSGAARKPKQKLTATQKRRALKPAKTPRVKPRG
jgi:hypothetical protein